MNDFGIIFSRTFHSLTKLLFWNENENDIEMEIFNYRTYLTANNKLIQLAHQITRELSFESWSHDILHNDNQNNNKNATLSILTVVLDCVIYAECRIS
jgi:hypothetical protein